tara:strand:+ start:976 stop:1548 length:573 start_codon:yes stop_codon:yes gene_type:complete
MTSTFSMDDLAKLLQQANTKKPRKKIERTAEQEKAMKEKLALMREKSMANRQAKAASKPPSVIIQQPAIIEPQIRTLEVQKLNEKDTDALFEKKYNSRFEKLDQTMEHVKLSLDEIKEMKKQKVLERQKAKEEAKVIPEIKLNESTPETRFSTKSDALPQIKPTTALPISIPINPNRVPKTPDYRNLFKR